MTREPPFNAPASAHTLNDLQQTIEYTLHRVAANGIGGNYEGAAKSLTIAIDMHIRQLMKEQKP